MRGTILNLFKKEYTVYATNSNDVAAHMTVNAVSQTEAAGKFLDHHSGYWKIDHVE